MRIRSRSRNRARGGGSSLDNALLTLASYGASDAWDFANGVWLRDGRVTSDPGLTVTRASVGTAQTADGRIVTFGSGVRRQTDKGLLVEGARTNLFLNSAVGETQTITVTAAAHTLSFYGTGTITLSGVSTDGPLVGTGAGQRVTLTFTPTAGSLTLTVSGTVEYVQLEVGAFASSWIPTESTSVARAADQITVAVNTTAQLEAAVAGQPERVTNGTFDTDSDWTKSAGWTIGSGVATFAAASANRAIQQNIGAVTAGRTYLLSYTVKANTLNGGAFRLGGFSGNSIHVLTNLTATVGMHTLLFPAAPNGAGNILDLWVTSGATSGSLELDDVSIKEIPVNAIGVTTYPLTLFAEFERTNDTGAAEGVFQVDALLRAQRADINISSSDTLSVTARGGANNGDASVTGTVAVGAITKSAGRFETNKVQAARAGSLATEDTTASMPIEAPNTVRFGDTGATAAYGFVYLRRVFIAPALTDAQLQQVTT